MPFLLHLFLEGREIVRENWQTTFNWFSWNFSLIFGLIFQRWSTSYRFFPTLSRVFPPCCMLRRTWLQNLLNSSNQLFLFYILNFSACLCSVTYCITCESSLACVEKNIHKLKKWRLFWRIYLKLGLVISLCYAIFIWIFNYMHVECLRSQSTDWRFPIKLWINEFNSWFFFF